MSVDRRDRRRGTLLTLAGEIDLDTAPQLHQAVQECLREGIHVIEIDLAGVTFCDISGLNEGPRGFRTEVQYDLSS